MNTTSINSLWNFLQTLSLTKTNKEWLAEKLIESSKHDEAKYTIEELDDHLMVAEADFASGNYLTMEQADKDMEEFVNSL